MMLVDSNLLNNSITMLLLSASFLVTMTQSFHLPQQPPTTALMLAPGRASSSSSSCLHMSSFAADGSEYSSKAADYEDDESSIGALERFGRDPDDEDGSGDSEVKELSPVPMSKNAGNRFVALYFDEDIDIHGRDVLDLHYDRDDLNEDHVMFCRKRNLYNETFNTDSMVDILRSLPM